MRQWHFTLVVMLHVVLGCAANPQPSSVPAVTGDLVEVQAPMPGMLLVKPDHLMGSYDRLMVDPVIISFADSSDRLSDAQRQKLADYLREATSRELVNVDSSQLVTSPGPCTLRMQTAFLDLDLPNKIVQAGSRTTILHSYGSVFLLHELRDSQSGVLLLRFIGRIKAEGGAVVGSSPDWRRMTRTLDRMLYELQSNLVAAVPPSVATAGRLASCGGQLYKTIQALRPELSDKAATSMADQ